MPRFYKLLSVVSMLLVSATVFAQTNVELHITHKMNGGYFGYNNTAKSESGTDFTITRMSYYISNISIKHDGGTITKVPDHYILVKADKDVTDALGSFNITNVESITFSIGVDTPENFEDPALYPATDPLALQIPSMHWGWSAGYIFCAIEGMGGPGMAWGYEVHAVGSSLYKSTTVTTGAVAKNGKLIIALNADYGKAIKNLPVQNAGMVEHGDGTLAQTLISNFQNHVFSAGNPVSVSNTTTLIPTVYIFPNPSTGIVEVASDYTLANICVYDMQGRLIVKQVNPGTNTKFNINTAGLYVLKAEAVGGNTVIQKVEIR